jgi:hypothetical protein
VIIGKTQRNKRVLAARALDASPLVRGNGCHGLEFLAALFAVVFIDRHGVISFPAVLKKLLEQTFD